MRKKRAGRRFSVRPPRALGSPSSALSCAPPPCCAPPPPAWRPAWAAAAWRRQAPSWPAAAPAPARAASRPSPRKVRRGGERERESAWRRGCARTQASPNRPAAARAESAKILPGCRRGVDPVKSPLTASAACVTTPAHRRRHDWASPPLFSAPPPPSRPSTPLPSPTLGPQTSPRWSRTPTPSGRRPRTWRQVRSEERERGRESRAHRRACAPSLPSSRALTLSPLSHIPPSPFIPQSWTTPPRPCS